MRQGSQTSAGIRSAAVPGAYHRAGVAHGIAQHEGAVERDSSKHELGDNASNPAHLGRTPGQGQHTSTNDSCDDGR